MSEGENGRQLKVVTTSLHSPSSSSNKKTVPTLQLNDSPSSTQMASINLANKTTRFSNQHTPCTRTHQIAALALIAATFFLTRLFDHSLAPCSPRITSLSAVNQQNDVVSWPLYQPNLKIYVYEEDEIDGLKLLLYGREGKITADACVKGQWGTQVITVD